MDVELNDDLKKRMEVLIRKVKDQNVKFTKTDMEYLTEIVQILGNLTREEVI
jgi:hypothetical protein